MSFPHINPNIKLTDIVGRNVAGVKEAYIALERQAARLGLRVNEDKTKYMVAGRTTRTTLRWSLLTLKTKTLIYKTLIRPVLTYASESWSTSRADEELLHIFRTILDQCARTACSVDATILSSTGITQTQTSSAPSKYFACDGPVI